MFIQTKAGKLDTLLEFFPGKAVYEGGPLTVDKAEAAERSKLAEKLYQIDGIEQVTLKEDSIELERSSNVQWDDIRVEALSTIAAYFQSGEKIVENETTDQDDFSEEIIEQIKDLLETRIVPAVTQSGGDVAFHSFENGNLYLKLQGSAFSMLTGITNMLRHYVPEVKAVLDHREALPRPGLQSKTGLAIRDLLHERINPSIAAHGGHITLVDVKEDKAYVRLEGGCQGCGMADVTLKQGVAKEIMSLVPEITEVLDVTDHAGGTNPYYQPA
ncbi:NifU family protein [Sneathiella glossodoripedis]|uniref:NifU family protein n=1 Tax=Sneathiella glossodoripedis TaxID=418853 RepID=UPI000471089D|nr:NifU family protein [Sneathiella glossodoripedis]